MQHRHAQASPCVLTFTVQAGIVCDLKGTDVKVLLLLLALATLAACGMITHGTSQNIACTTSPAGARVRATDGTECTTPCALTLKRKKDDLLTIEKEGYETVNLPVRSVVSGATAGNILMPGGLICWAIDHISGAEGRLVPERVNIDLKPAPPRAQPFVGEAGDDAPL